ncbi:glutaredoxin domain-containing protein [Streptomyces sp. SID9727]|uniref:glutaredoxin domain-containing protein n=1 Tax=Streptomyces sp. SID9727 TaxID=2706114 RepID=UPI001943716E|nr:glutaredoxin domain-containing protein [Streptomyces sp. SID9727]
MRRVWLLPILFLTSGAVGAAGLFVWGSTRQAVIILLAFALCAALNSPLVFPRSVSAAEARRRSAVDGRPVVFWRPGCAYCLRLRFRLRRHARRLHWVDIWRDPEAAAAVRAVNDGNETVPTVFVAGRAHTNPDPAWVRAQLTRPAR